MRISHFERKERRGTVTLEMAVVLPLLVLLVFIGVDFARVYYHELTLINAARNGAVYASAHPDHAVNTTQIEQVVLQDTTNLTPDPTVTSNITTDAAGIDYVTVTVEWGFNTVMDYPGVAHPLVLERSVKMRIAPANPRQN